MMETSIQEMAATLIVRLSLATIVLILGQVGAHVQRLVGMG